MSGSSFRRLVNPRILPWLCWLQIVVSLALAAYLTIRDPLLGVPLLLLLPIATRVAYELISMLLEIRNDLKVVAEPFPKAVDMLGKVNAALPKLQARLDNIAPNIDIGLQTLDEMLRAAKQIAAYFPPIDGPGHAAVAPIAPPELVVEQIVDLVEGGPVGAAGENAKPVVQGLLNVMHRRAGFVEAGAQRNI